MPLLRDSEDDLFALIGETSAALNLNTAFVEKDYWVTELLRSLTRPISTTGNGTAAVVFKGGTSLSKAYELIERFSEDVDVLLVTGGLGQDATATLLKSLCSRAASDLGLDEDDDLIVEGSRRGARDVRYLHPSQYQSDAISSGVLLEIGIRGGPEPNQVCRLRSMIATYAIQNGVESPTAWEEFAEVEVVVLAAERTLIEKLALLHHKATQVHQHADTLRAAGRHFYDVFSLLSSPLVLDALRDLPGGVESMAANVDELSESFGWPHTQRPADGYAASPAFAPDGPSFEIGQDGYLDAMDLVWGAKPTFEEGLSLVEEHRALL